MAVCRSVYGVAPGEMPTFLLNVLNERARLCRSTAVPTWTSAANSNLIRQLGRFSGQSLRQILVGLARAKSAFIYLGKRQTTIADTSVLALKVGEAQVRKRIGALTPPPANVPGLIAVKLAQTTGEMAPLEHFICEAIMFADRALPK